MKLIEEFYLDKETDRLIESIEKAYPELCEQGLGAGQPSSAVTQPGVVKNTPNSNPATPPKPQGKPQQQPTQQQGPIDPKLARLAAWLLKLSTDEMSKSHVLKILNNALKKGGHE